MPGSTSRLLPRAAWQPLRGSCSGTLLCRKVMQKAITGVPGVQASAGAQQVVDGKLVEADEAEARLPHRVRVEVLDRGGLVVEMAWAVVRRAAGRPTVFQQVDQGERVEQIAVAEDQVLIELDAPLAVEVDVEQLAVP